RMKHISPTTVIRILRSLRPKTISLSQLLPEVVCFAEFKSVKNVSGAMSFVMMDGKTHQLIDIVENRQLNPLRDYFLRYPRKVREQVRLVVSDFYTPYRTLVKECFPNARIVADRFHISQHSGRAFTNHRIQVMKTFKKGDRRSKHLKKYWKLLQKNAWELKGQHRYWRPSFRDHLTEAEIVDRLLSYDDSLK
ncbi:transposase, partial [Klebsiella pneumoniae]|uniref:transposase n=1 Tax=Klebsiella pneumoniae TaxID=573 RepID=UPI0018DB727E